MKFVIFLSAILIYQLQIEIPINSKNRKNISGIQLTEIGQFGLLRKARKNIPSHYHTGIDIKRPNKNYTDEPVYAIAEGIVISKRTDGPYANIIIEHNFNGIKIWTLYEHVAGIKVKVYDRINSKVPIARFMNREELIRYGWQFDHFHFEILKQKPKKMKPDKAHPERFFCSYSLLCFSESDLQKYFFNPMEFIQGNN